MGRVIAVICSRREGARKVLFNESGRGAAGDSGEDGNGGRLEQRLGPRAHSPGDHEVYAALGEPARQQARLMLGCVHIGGTDDFFVDGSMSTNVNCSQ